jgi:hypothetical protein
VDLTEDHRGPGDLGPGLVNEKVVETHAPSPSSWPFGHPVGRHRLYARTTRARSLRPGGSGGGEVRRSGRGRRAHRPQSRAAPALTAGAATLAHHVVRGKLRLAAPVGPVSYFMALGLLGRRDRL